MNIKYHIYIAKIPSFTEQQFENFLYQNLPKNCSFEKTYKCDQTVSTLTEKYTFYKIFSDEKTLNQLCYMKKYQNKTFRKEYGYTRFYRNNYLTPFISAIQTDVYEISKFYEEYLKLLYSINRKQLQGIEYLLYPHLIYPFRNTKQDITQIQNSYNINFFDTLIIPDNIKPQKVNKYSCDEIYYIDIDQLKNAPQSNAMQDMNQYYSLMFDIENAVYISSQHNNEQPTTNLLQENEKKEGHSDDYVKFISQFRQAREGKEAFYDYNKIICVSCIEQKFSGELGQKFALVNLDNQSELVQNQLQCSFEELPMRIKQEMDKQEINMVDQVIVCNTEKELLIQLSNILSSPKYHIIQHFNGWNFDERMIMSRMCLYDYLFEEYYQKMKTIKNSPQETDKWNLSYTSSYKNGTGMSADKHDLCMLKDGLKFSFDVYQINLKDSVDSQKHDDNTLNGLLNLYGLGLKGDVSYQELTNSFYDMQHQLPLLIKGYWYCQRDSIQQCKLQAHLKQILNYLQFSSLCKIPLQVSVQKAVGQKIVATQAYYLNQCDLPYLDIVPPYEIAQGLNINEEGEEEERLKNIGGEVICFAPGFAKYVSAVDASSMYPAQVEANNISNDCMLLPQDLEYILLHQQEFNITNITVKYLHDMYSPSNNSWKRIPIIEQLHKFDVDRIYYIQPPNEKLLKFYRYEIILTINGKELIYQQFFYQKKDMSPIYNYVFYLQGKNEQNQPYSPSARMLTSLRFLRKDVKKSIKTAKDPVMKEFYEMKQGAIKIVMNGFYGTKDINCYPTYELIGPSTITYQSRCIIQNCRDHLTHVFHRVNSKIISAMQSSLETYNKFINQVYYDISTISVQFNSDKTIMRIPKLVMKYQDTDSNYFTMPALDSIKVKQEYLPEEHYIKTHTFGLFNDVFRSYINICMDKFPLEFGFEGAFYRAWHIQKKMYLGQKSEQYVCHIDQGKIIHDYDLHEKIIMSDFNPETDDIYKYLKKNHIKITGLQLIKRNTTILLKRYYIKLLEYVLNQEYNNTISQETNPLEQYLVSLLHQFEQEFPTLPLKQFIEPKKINEKDLSKPYVQEYNHNNPDQQIGLGTVMNTVVIKPGDIIGNQFHKTSFKVENNKIIIKPEDFLKQDPRIYYGYYLYNIAKNLLTFIAPDNQNTELTDDQKDAKIDKQTKALLEKYNFVQFSRNTVKYTLDTYNYVLVEQFIALYDYWQSNCRQHGQLEFFDQNYRWNGNRLQQSLEKYLRKNQFINIPRVQNYCNMIRALFMRDVINN